jgi:MoaA/NifB/PqqE/SkfB family radical SAM enzyme
MEWQQVLDKAWHAGILQVIFTGGEPTLRDDLLDLIRHTEENGQVAGLITDGLLFRDENYLNAVIKSGLDHIVILINPERSEIWQIIDFLVAADIYITIHLTFTTENKVEMDNAVSKVIDTGIHALSMSYADQNLAETVRAIRERVADSGLAFVWGLPIPFPERDLGSLIPESDDGSQYTAGVFIAPDGKIAQNSKSETFAGNLNREPWDAIWSRLTGSM